MTQAALRNYIAARASTSSTSQQPLGTKLDKDIELRDTLGFIVTGNMNAGQTVCELNFNNKIQYLQQIYLSYMSLRLPLCSATLINNSCLLPGAKLPTTSHGEDRVRGDWR